MKRGKTSPWQKPGGSVDEVGIEFLKGLHSNLCAVLSHTHENMKQCIQYMKAALNKMIMKKITDK